MKDFFDSTSATRKILIITNDFPPKRGGIEKFVIGIAMSLPAKDIIVLTSSSVGDIEFDASLDFPVYRYPAKYLLPTPHVLKIARQLISHYGCTRIWFGAAAPLALLAKPLRSAGINRIVATTHGHEIWWARLPFTRHILRAIGKYCDVVTYLGEYTHKKLRKALGPQATMHKLVPGVDSTVFRPDPGARQFLVHKYSIPADSLIILSLSRLIERKGQDQLIKIWPEIQQSVPQAKLLIAGSGPYKQRLAELAQAAKAEDSIIFCSTVSDEEIPLYYAGAQIFAMPCRSRKGGLEVEGLGIVFLEAQAAGLPVIVGNSGGAPDAVLPGETGIVVDGHNLEEISQAMKTLCDPTIAAVMSQKARVWAEHEWSWEKSAKQLLDMLDL